MSEETIFLAALDKRDAAERSAYLNEACAGDPALRQRVEALLQSHEEAGPFLQHPALERGGETQTAPGDGARGDLALDFLAPSERPGALGRLGHYDVLEVVGRGGFGVVLKAFDNVLQRVVAVKVMAPQLAVTASARKRFIREAQAAAAVRDEHVIDIHAVEEVNGLPYLVMEYVNGLSLQERLDRDGPLELKEVLRIAMQTASGLAKAHAQGLVHRDVKPANILLENGVQRVKITDFGLARAVDDASLTQSGLVAGTPMYMAPEQARGEPVDHRSDLFSLGSVLYAMCTGRPPFRASTALAVLKRVSEDTPRPVREVNPEVPDWLAALIARLHAKAPADRYQSAVEVAEELSLHLVRLQDPAAAARREARPVAPRPAARPRARRWAAAAAVLLLAGGLGVSEATGVTKLTATVIRVFSPDGTLVVEVDDPHVRVTIDGEDIRILGAGPHEVRVRPGVAHRFRAVKDGQTVRQELVTVERGGKRVVRVSREGAGQAEAGSPITLRATLRREDMLNDNRQRIAFSPDGLLLAAPCDDGRITLWDVTTGQVRTVLEGHKLPTTAVAFAPDGKRLATAAGDYHKRNVNGEVKLWDAATGKLLFTLPSSTGPVFSVAFAPDGETVASAGTGGTVHLWDAATGKEQAPLRSPKGAGYGLAYAPDGKTLAVSLIDTVQLWDVTTRQKKGLLEGHLDEVECVTFSPDGETLATGSRDHTVKLWDAATLKERATLQGHLDWVTSVAFAPDGKTLASASNRYFVKLWDVTSGKALADVPAPGVAAGSRVAFTPDGKTLASGRDGIIRLWDVSRRASPPRTQEAAPTPFVLLSRGGRVEQPFATLAEAVGAAAAGDTVEVRGDGPFWLDASGVTIDRALTIRAGAGCRPVFKLAQAQPGQGRNKHLLDIYAPVTLEGLDFDRTGEHEGPTRERAALFVQNGPLRMANCRLRTGGMAHYLVWLRHVREADVRNCLFTGSALRSICVAFCSDGDRLTLTNCVFASTSQAVLFTEEQDRLASSLRVSLVGNTFAALPLGWDHSSSRELQLEARDNVAAGPAVIDFQHAPRGKSWKELATAVRWEGERNLYPAGGPWVEIDGRPAPRSEGLNSGWKAGTPRFQGGDAQGWQAAMLETDYWRLAADSPGKGAGEGGRDLGADVDLVGPGPAYERWKKTPEYRQWLQDTSAGRARR
jgi:WD40 repeat protein